MATGPKPSVVASVILPGADDPKATIKNGTFSMEWGGTTVTQFNEVEIPRIKDEGYQLPTIYLHFLHQDFRIADGLLDQSLRSGNDMGEVVMKLPASYFSAEFVEECKDVKKDVEEVLKALRGQGEVVVSRSKPEQGKADPTTLFFSLKTARPKAALSLDKKAAGIPLDAEQYLFVNNHSSVVHFDDIVKEAFNKCIGSLPDVGSEAAAKFATFLKVFYEGGFGYNKKIPMDKAYLPVNVGTAAISVFPAFEGQTGIETGNPYQLPAPFLPFTETVSISINAIRSMSEFHGRYGVAFTRMVYFWEGDLWAESKTLDFCSIVPNGGFFYVPENLRDHQAKGGLVYAFGEKD